MAALHSGQLRLPRGGLSHSIKQKVKKNDEPCENPRATILIDKDEIEHGIMIECNSRVLAGSDADEMRDYMRRVNRWQNDQDTVVIKLDPVRKTSW